MCFINGINKLTWPFWKNLKLAFEVFEVLKPVAKLLGTRFVRFIWPLHHLVLVIPPYSLYKVSSSKTLCSKLRWATLNGGKGGEGGEGGREGVLYLREAWPAAIWSKKGQFFFKVPQHFATGGKERNWIWSHDSYIACVAGVQNGREREFGPKSPFPSLSNTCHTG